MIVLPAGLSGCVFQQLKNHFKYFTDMVQENIERQIVIGLITSTDYTTAVRPLFRTELLKSKTAARLAMWAVEYFDEFKKAPGRAIETIYFNALRAGSIPEDLAQELEEDILPDLSEEYEQTGLNVHYLQKITETYLTDRSLTLHAEKISNALDIGNIVEAEKIASSYTKPTTDQQDDIDLSHPTIAEQVRQAFKEGNECVVRYTGPLGEIWNPQMVRGAFIGFLAPEKRGKTFLFLDIAMRAARQRRTVAFFQAGDMTQRQQLKRICVYRAKKSDREQYCGIQYLPVKDCVHNQMDTCNKQVRECGFGPFADFTGTITEFKKQVTMQGLKDAHKDPNNRGYKPCHNCQEFNTNPWGTAWIEKKNLKSPLDVEQAIKEVDKFFVTNKRHFRLSSHAAGTLSVKGIRAELDLWQTRDNFIPDIIIVDYADIMAPSEKTEYRHQQNSIWRDLRGLSQERNCLVLTASQTDADSYSRDSLTLSNFSEDKRKYAHVTAMYGLNQDHKGREKQIGIMRINELVVREGEFDIKREITVLQSLKTGQPMITNYL